MSNRLKSIFDAHAHDWAEHRAGARRATRFIEEPAVFAEQAMSGARVLCIACGAGDECEKSLALGAKQVVGVDISVEMLKIAATRTTGLLSAMNMERLAIQAEVFDLVICRLAAHYLRDWNTLLTEIHRVLVPGGRCVLSVYHPVFLSLMKDESIASANGRLGFVARDAGGPEISGDYLAEREVIKSFRLGPERVPVSLPLFARPVSALIGDVLRSPLDLESFEEPRPVPQTAAEDPALSAIHHRIPIFAVLTMTRPVEPAGRHG